MFKSRRQLHRRIARKRRLKREKLSARSLAPSDGLLSRMYRVADDKTERGGMRLKWQKGERMDRVEAKEFLMRGWRVEREISALLSARQQLYDRATRATADLNAPTSGTKNPHVYDRLAEFSEAVDGRLAELLNIETEIVGVINKVERRSHRELLLLRYVRFLTWERIAVEMNYSIMSVWRMHGAALQDAQKILDAER